MFAITKRLLLRPGWPEDAAPLAAAIGRWEVVRRLARAPWPYGEADAAAFLASPEDVSRPRFAVTSRADGAIIGGIGLHRAGADGAAAELGYWLVPAAWGSGLATEAARAVLTIADVALGLERVVATCALDNPASARVLAKLGFVAADAAPHEIATLSRGPVAVQPMVRIRGRG